MSAELREHMYHALCWSCLRQAFWRWLRYGHTPPAPLPPMPVQAWEPSILLAILPAPGTTLKVGQRFKDEETGVVYVWDGEVWKIDERYG